MSVEISTRRRRDVIDALRRGAVPHSGLDVRAVALDRFVGAVDATVTDLNRCRSEPAPLTTLSTGHLLCSIRKEGCRMSPGLSESAKPGTYRPMTLKDLARHLAAAQGDEDRRWRLVAEFLEEYRHESPDVRRGLLSAEPPTTHDEHWDVFVAALAEHLAARDGRRGPIWSERRSLDRFWFPFNTRADRADAIVHAPAAFRRRGVFVAAHELEVA